MEVLLSSDKRFHPFEYGLEKDFEKVIVEQAEQIFGRRSIYVDIKKRIGSSIITIPDGYLIDFTFKDNPRLYIIENELSSHDPYKHIGSQILKFAISYKDSGRKIKAFLLDYLMADKKRMDRFNKIIQGSEYRNIDDLLEKIIFEKPVAAIVIIDNSTPELENVLSQLTIDTDIIEFQTYTCGDDKIHKFIPFNSEVRDWSDDDPAKVGIEALDTIVVPAREEGFEREFIQNKRWYAVRMSSAMIDKIKFVAAYQVSPISAVTYLAEISHIEKWQDTNKYVLYFKGDPQKLKNPIRLNDKERKGVAPQAPRYTSSERILSSRYLFEIFS